MKVFVRINRIGWVHLWLSRESYEIGDPSAHFFNGKSEPRWVDASFSDEALNAMARGELVEIEDPGYFDEDDIASAADSSL